MRSNISWFACLIFVAGPLHAQQGDHVSLKVDVVAWGNEIKGLSLKTGVGKGAITALPFRYSTPVAYAGPVLMEIHQSANVPAAPAAPAIELPAVGKLNPLVAENKAGSADDPRPKQGLALELEKRRRKEPTLVALAVLPGGACRRATVLLAPVADGTFMSYVIDDDPAKLPVGRVRVHNLSPFLIAMRCNATPACELRTGNAIVVPATRGHLVYELAYKLGDEWKMQENNVIAVHPDEQAQMIILKSNNSFFLASDGTRSGFLQIVTLRRSPEHP